MVVHDKVAEQRKHRQGFQAKMASTPTHRSSQSTSVTLQPPAQGSSLNSKEQRRMTSPARSVNLAPPEGGRRPSPRPPSPLRNGIIMDTSTGIDPDEESDEEDDDDDDPSKWERSPSPASSVSNLAASFVQRMNNFVGGMKTSGTLTDAELEAEAEMERDRSRREAEAILTREAQQRKLVEERVLAMMETTRSLPPPPSRSQTLSNPPSPSNSQKESNWWTAAKNKLTPTKEKEPLTPAQQVILEAKTREKEKKKEIKGKDKDKEWPSNAQGKFNDPAYANLHIPVAPPTRKPVPASPSSPTPSRPSLSNMPPNLTPSPMRADTISSSPSQEAPPIYVQFSASGTLDVAGTLLAIAKRFEKLEKWTVGHVRALEERMNDVERWLVDKEKEKEETASMKEVKKPDVPQELHEMREEMSELQGRVGELGREMAKMATAPSRLSSGPSTQTAAVSSGHQTTVSMLAEQHTGSSLPGSPHHRRMSTTARESTSPPIASNRTPSGTRLPYPQGDYTSPPDTFSPPNSPPGSLNTRRTLPPTQGQPISGLPNTAPPSSGSNSHSYSYSLGSNSSTTYGRTTSPTPMPGYATARAVSPNPSPSGLPPPKGSSQRQSSVSPTPRKRYTVALGGPLIPDELSSNAASTDTTPTKAPSPAPTDQQKRTGTPRLFARPRTSIDNFFSTIPTPNLFDDDDSIYNGTGKDNSKDSNNNNKEDEDMNEFGGETIGKSAAARMASSGSLDFSSKSVKGDHKSGLGSLTATSNQASASAAPATGTSPSSLSNRRTRAQSAYGFSNIAGASGTNAASVLSSYGTPSVAPLALRKTRSKSTERLTSSVGGNGSGTGDGMISALAGPGQNKFVDPLVLRKQSKDALMKPIAMPKPIGKKVPIGQLVAFFDRDGMKK